MLIMALYNQTTPSLKYISLAEEWLPFTDILPSATIGWMMENMPWLIKEWKQVFETTGGRDTNSGIGPNNNDTDSSNTCTKYSKSQPTLEQKRAILQDMQNYSERLSVHS
jgi:hypothetical protein